MNTTSDPDNRISGTNLYRIGAVSCGSTPSNLDYDIFEIEDPKLRMLNRLPLPRAGGRPQEFLNITEIATEIIESEVLIATGQNGVVKGTILGNSYFIKMAGCVSYQKMWPVELQEDIGESCRWFSLPFLPQLIFYAVPGDSGSWVVDAKSGSLYGHIVAGDASLHRAYIISANDVMLDLRTRFGHDASIKLSDANEECVAGVGGSQTTNTDAEPTAFRNQLRDGNVLGHKASLVSHSSNNLGHTTSINSNNTGRARYATPPQYPEAVSTSKNSLMLDLFSKEWNPEFSRKRHFDTFSRSSWVDRTRAIGADGDGIRLFLEYCETSVPSSMAVEIEDFCDDTTLIDLQSGSGAAGRRRGAWLDDRSALSSTRRCEATDHQNPLTATALYRQLKKPV